MVKSRLMHELYETAQGLHKIGMMGDQIMRDFDAEMLSKDKGITPKPTRVIERGGQKNRDLD